MEDTKNNAINVISSIYCYTYIRYICQLVGIAILQPNLFSYSIFSLFIVHHNFNMIVSTSPLGGRQRKYVTGDIVNCAIPLYVQCNKTYS
jgi:hypothetical protein